MVSFTQILGAVGIASSTAYALPPIVRSPCTLTAEWNVKVNTQFGDKIFVVGTPYELGSWNVSNALQMSAANWTAENPTWTVDLGITHTNPPMEYKYVWVKADGSEEWEKDQSQVGGSGRNRVFEQPMGRCYYTFPVFDTWNMASAAKSA